MCTSLQNNMKCAPGKCQKHVQRPLRRLGSAWKKNCSKSRLKNAVSGLHLLRSPQMRDRRWKHIFPLTEERESALKLNRMSGKVFGRLPKLLREASCHA